MELLAWLLQRARPIDFSASGQAAAEASSSNKDSKESNKRTSASGTGNTDANSVHSPAQMRSFKAFCRWRSAASSLLEAGLAACAAEGWRGDASSLRGAMARFKGAARRMAVTSLDEFEEGEYSEVSD